MSPLQEGPRTSLQGKFKARESLLLALKKQTNLLPCFELGRVSGNSRKPATWPTTSKKVGIAVLQSQGSDLGQQLVRLEEDSTPD